MRRIAVFLSLAACFAACAQEGPSPTPTLAPTPLPTPTPPCGAGSLRVKFADFDGRTYGGPPSRSLSSDVMLQLTNASSRKCWMGSFPEFQLFDGKGRALGIPFVGQDQGQHAVFGDVAPGGSAQTILRWNGPYCLVVTQPVHVKLKTPNGDTVDIVPKPNLAAPGCRAGLKARTSTLTSGGWATIIIGSIPGAGKVRTPPS